METSRSQTTAELLARLPRLPEVKRPFFSGPDHIARDIDEEGVELLEEMISGRFLDYMLEELLAELPDVGSVVEALGPAGLVLQARPSNTINALTIPTGDGVVVVYNLGLYSMLYSASVAAAMALSDRHRALVWLTELVDWATSLAMEPRTGQLTGLTDEDQGLATNIASRAQRFGLCHELGHLLSFDRAEQPDRVVTVEGVAVDALRDSWEKEYAADRDGLELYLRVLVGQDGNPVSAIIGAELFLNAAGMLQESSADEGQSHPPPDERLSRLRRQFLEALGPSAPEMVAPALELRDTLEWLRLAVTELVARRRAETTLKLQAAFTAYAADAAALSTDEKRERARAVSRLLLESPGATLSFLHDQLFAPRAEDEPDGGSPNRLLAVNAALHFERPLQEALELQRLGVATGG